MTQVNAETRGPRPSIRRALLGPALVLAGMAAVVVLVATVDPHEPGHYPACPFLWTTGLYCPGCGTLRVINSLAHGRPGAAFGLNPLVFVLLPVLAYLWGRWTMLSARGEPMRSALLQPRVIYVFVAVVAVFWIVRNLPFGAALAP